jgi:ubiquinone/menaquinone biosynthesis C-methylase UbiE
MLPRVLEAEGMDTEAEARDYDAMDFAEVNRAFVADFLAAWTGFVPILDVCTGTARIPIELCRHITSPRPYILGIDLAEHMLAVAQRNIDASPFCEHLAVMKADARRIPFVDACFGAVICNGSVHHIADPFDCFAEMHRMCWPGGTLFVRDLLRPPNLTSLEAILNRHAAGANDHQRAMFAASLHASLALDEVRELVGRLGYPPESVQQTSDRHWTWSATRL